MLVYCFVVGTHWGSSLHDAYLNQRGWVLQERMLRIRSLHYSSQLFWECRTLQACETYPAGLPHDPNTFADAELFVDPSSL